MATFAGFLRWLEIAMLQCHAQGVRFLKRKGVAAIVFHDLSNPQFLLMHRILHWIGWEFLKGGVYDGETEEETLRREIEEETGKKNFKIVKKLSVTFDYDYSGDYKKQIHCKYEGATHSVFLVEFPDKKVQVDNREHDSYKWVSKQAALKMLTHQNQKDTFSKALDEML